MLSQIRSAFLLLLLVIFDSRCRAQSESCKAELAALAQELPHLSIRTTSEDSAFAYDTMPQELFTQLAVNLPGVARAQAAGSSYYKIVEEFVGNTADSEDFVGRLLSVSAYSGDLV